jgi:hypothetical protein
MGNRIRRQKAAGSLAAIIGYMIVFIALGCAIQGEIHIPPNEDFCYDPILITEPKTFHNKGMATLLGLKDPCHSRRRSGVPLSPAPEIILPTDTRAR